MNNWEKCLAYLPWEEFTQTRVCLKKSNSDNSSQKFLPSTSTVRSPKCWKKAACLCCSRYYFLKLLFQIHVCQQISTYMGRVAVVVDTHRHLLYPGITLETPPPSKPLLPHTFLLPLLLLLLIPLLHFYSTWWRAVKFCQRSTFFHHFLKVENICNHSNFHQLCCANNLLCFVF